MEGQVEKAVAGMEALEVTVRYSGGTFRTAKVQGQQASCTYSELVAVESLAGKLFRHWRVTLIEGYPHGVNGNLTGRWRMEGWQE